MSKYSSIGIHAAKDIKRGAKRAAKRVKKAAKKAKRAAKRVVKKVKRAAKRIKRAAKKAVHRKRRAAKATPQERVQSERDILRSRIQKANRRLASLEKENLQELSRAYRNVEGFAEKYKLDGGASIFKVDEETGAIRFRTDLAKLEKENPDLVKQLETRLNHFLQAPTSTAREVKFRQEMITNDTEKYLEYLQKASPKEYEALEKAVETMNKHFAAEAIYRGVYRPSIDVEEYVRMFYTDIWGLLEKFVPPSKERVEIAHNVATGLWSKETVKEYLMTLTKGEEKNAKDIEEYVLAGMTPEEKRIYVDKTTLKSRKKTTWNEKVQKSGGFDWYKK